MKKILLNETQKISLILEREKAIRENFAKTFNKIKRIDENELHDKMINCPYCGSSNDVKNEEAIYQKSRIQYSPNIDIIFHCNNCQELFKMTFSLTPESGFEPYP
jgi:transposase-like protein